MTGAPPDPRHDPQGILRALFDAAVAAADPLRVVPPHLPPRPKGRLVVIGAGKASARMAEAVEAHYGPCEGLVITRYGHGRPTRGIEIVEAGHPVPDAAGVAATERMLRLVSGLGPDDLVLALISGGGSALLCAPAAGVTLADKMAVTRALLDCGAPIDQINTVRKHLSRVKGGQLAVACHPARVLGLLISDVPGDDPAVIASGPLSPEGSTPAEALAILERHALVLPEAVRTALMRRSSVLPPGDPLLDRVETRIIAAPSRSLQAAADLALASGCDVRLLGDDLEGEARELGARQARMALSLTAETRAGGRPLVILSGGECTVTRRGDGVGGPNAEFALAAALTLEGAPGIHVLACDTDGVDGAAEIAGAIAGPATLARARAAGIDPGAALARNDAHGFFAAIDGQVVTGPTLTNVNDFRAVLIVPTDVSGKE